MLVVLVTTGKLVCRNFLVIRPVQPSMVTARRYKDEKQQQTAHDTYLSSIKPFLSYILSCRIVGGSTTRLSLSVDDEALAISGCCRTISSYLLGSLSGDSNSFTSTLSFCRLDGYI